MSLRLSIAVAAVLLATGCSSSTPDASTPLPAPVTEAPAPLSPSPSTRPGEVGTPFDVAGWKVTLIGVSCGAPARVLGGSDDGSHRADVCVADIRYTNSTSGAARFDDTGPDFAGFDRAGKRYEGTRWLAGPVNPGVEDKNQLIFDVAAGVKLVAVRIGDVQIAVSA